MASSTDDEKLRPIEKIHIHLFLELSNHIAPSLKTTWNKFIFYMRLHLSKAELVECGDIFKICELLFQKGNISYGKYDVLSNAFKEIGEMKCCDIVAKFTKEIHEAQIKLQNEILDQTLCTEENKPQGDREETRANSNEETLYQRQPAVQTDVEGDREETRANSNEETLCQRQHAVQTDVEGDREETRANSNEETLCQRQHAVQTGVEGRTMTSRGKNDVQKGENNSADDDSAKMKLDLINKFVHDVGRVEQGMPVLTVAFIGTIGAGVSSTINTCIAAFSETNYKEFALSGNFSDRRRMTNCVERIAKERYIPERKNYRMPTFVDTVGFSDEDSDLNEYIIHIFSNGCLPEGDSLKVDRIIFVASAADNVPQHFIQRLVDAVHPTGGMYARNRNIPIFGVMCKVDLVNVDDEEFQKREKLFIACLGLKGSEHRYTRLVNYCNDFDPDKKRMDSVFPELDVPALKFLRQVCASSYGGTGPAAEDITEVQDVRDAVVKKANEVTPPE